MMGRLRINLGGGLALLDIGSYARPGPSGRERFSPGQIELISRTVNRTPEVMVKMLNRGGRNLAAVRRHVDYLDREGALPIETDDGQRLQGKGASRVLLDDWDLDLEEERPAADLKPRQTRDPPKLVHKVLFSMPAGTPPKKVLAAAKNFAREEFGAKYRYAMVLHTDEPHPHVHMVVKAMGDDGKRLNIRRDTLRHWRTEFARHLRGQGVAANATERAGRGVTTPRKLDGIHRAAMRGASTHYRQRAQMVAREIATGRIKAESGRERLFETRRRVIQGWGQVAEELTAQGQRELALAVGGFVARMPAVQTEKEWIRDRLLEQSKVRHREERARSNGR
jgi:type IV secretory pathway VirD2 relaxase